MGVPTETCQSTSRLSSRLALRPVTDNWNAVIKLLLWMERAWWESLTSQRCLCWKEPREELFLQCFHKVSRIQQRIQSVLQSDSVWMATNCFDLYSQWYKSVISFYNFAKLFFLSALEIATTSSSLSLKIFVLQFMLTFKGSVRSMNFTLNRVILKDFEEKS